MPKSVNQRVTALRKRRALLGEKRIEYSLTDKEKIEVDKFLKKMRRPIRYIAMHGNIE